MGIDKKNDKLSVEDIPWAQGRKVCAESQLWLHNVLPSWIWSWKSITAHFHEEVNFQGNPWVYANGRKGFVIR